jgi:uridine kinase
MDDVRALLNMKIFVDTDDDVRLARRIKRDTCDRGRDVHGVLEQYTRFVKPMFDLYVSPSKKYADVIIPWAGGENGVAIDLIVQHIRGKLTISDQRRHYNNLRLLPTNYQIRGMHTIIRDANTSRNDFVFYADRLIRLVVEHGLGCLPFSDHIVQTPTGMDYNGVSFSNRLCGVSVIRSGESMENALRACCKGVKIGKILIRRERDTGPCRILYEKLPLDISRRYVLLLDPILASGASSIAAIDLLLSKGVAEERIIFLTLIAAPPGIKAICETYPLLTVVTTEIDVALSSTHVVLPGIGEFGDRYFGTDCISKDRDGEVSYASTTPADSAAASAARARLRARADADATVNGGLSPQVSGGADGVNVTPRTAATLMANGAPVR